MKKFAKVFGVIAAVALVVSVSVPAVSALTAADIDLLVALGIIPADKAAAAKAAIGGTTSSTSCATYTRDLTIGSTGADVVNLQSMLEAEGYLVIPVGVSKGYFGPLTQSALAKYQAAHGISPAVGYFGPITRGSIVCTPTTPSVPSTPGTSTGSTGVSLSGGAGSISDADFLASYNNEEVGEDEEDVKVAGLEIEADEGSDIQLIAVTLDFDQGSGATEDFDNYADEVSIWFDGDEVGRIDADEFNDNNNYQKTISIDGDAVIDADKMGDLVVAVSGISNLDSNDAGDTWTVEFVSVRFKDAQGAIITESTQGDIGGATRSFTFETFATASNTEFRLQAGDDSINDARVIDIDDTDETDNVAVFSFKIKISGDEVELKDLLATSTITGTANTLDDIFSKLTLEIDGDQVGSENPTASTTIIFDDIDTVLDTGTYDAVIYGDIKATSSATLAVGDTFLFQVGEQQTDDTRFDVEDKNGDNLLDADKVGTVTGEAHTLFADGIMAEFVNDTGTKSVTVDSTNNDYAELYIKFDVTNFGEDTLYIPNVLTFTGSSTTETRTAPSTSQGIGYSVQFSGTTSLASTNVSGFIANSTADLETNSYSVDSGETESFTIKVTVTNKAASIIDNTSVRALLSGIGWADTDSATSDSVYTVDLTNFESSWETVAD